MYYIYFILRYAPNASALLHEIAGYKQKGYFENTPKNLNKYFEQKSSNGNLMVEKENGSDEFVENIREDIFERFKKLREVL